MTAPTVIREQVETYPVAGGMQRDFYAILNRYYDLGDNLPPINVRITCGNEHKPWKGRVTVLQSNGQFADGAILNEVFTKGGNGYGEELADSLAADARKMLIAAKRTGA